MRVDGSVVARERRGFLEVDGPREEFEGGGARRVVRRPVDVHPAVGEAVDVDVRPGSRRVAAVPVAPAGGRPGAGQFAADPGGEDAGPGERRQVEVGGLMSGGAARAVRSPLGLPCGLLDPRPKVRLRARRGVIMAG